MLQDVAFGFKISTLDSGVNIVIPAEVHIIIPSRVLIEQYRIYCAQTDFESVGDRSLYRIIEVCASMSRRCYSRANRVHGGHEEMVSNLSRH